MTLLNYYLDVDIFLTGRMGSGKDYLANILVERAGYTRISFADALKQEVAALHGITVAELNANKAHYRADLQTWGVRQRGVGPDYWIEQWRHRRSQVPGPVICADMRFLNEAAFARSCFSLLVRVTVPEEVRIARLQARDGAVNPAWFTHESEQYVDTMQVDGILSGELTADEVQMSLARLHEQKVWRAATSTMLSLVSEGLR